MSLTLVRQLIRYRTLLVALTNAGITWVVLIVAPLGLFAVITCTVLVFLSSLMTNWVGDTALNALLSSRDRDTIQASREAATLDPHQSRYPGDRLFSSRRDRQLPR